jgi:magnesium-transporting ATPase (P-type)
MSLEQVHASLNSNERGLSEQEAQRRLKTNGYDELESRRPSGDPILLGQFTDLIFAILFAYAVTSGFFASIDRAGKHAKLVGLLAVARFCRVTAI